MGDVLHEEGAGVACRRGRQVQVRPERGKLCH